MKMKWLNTWEKHWNLWDDLKYICSLNKYFLSVESVAGTVVLENLKNNSFILKIYPTVGWMKNSLSLEGSDVLEETNT